MGRPDRFAGESMEGKRFSVALEPPPLPVPPTCMWEGNEKPCAAGVGEGLACIVVTVQPAIDESMYAIETNNPDRLVSIQ